LCAKLIVAIISTFRSRYDKRMKPLPVPPVPGKTDAERFDNAVRKTFTVSKEEMQRRETEWQRTQGKKAGTRKI
jgi:hypothetical protein